MRRREFLGGLGGAAATWPVGARAQPVRKKPVIGWVGGSTQEAGQRNRDAFLKGMRERGYQDGQDINTVFRWAGGSATSIPILVDELIAANAAVILAVINVAALAARKATTETPIVCRLLIDPIKLGLAESYNHPGLNVTGLLQSVDTLPAKQVELLIKVSPRTTLVGVLFNPANVASSILISGLETTTRGTSIRVVRVEASRPDDLPAAFEEMKKNGVSGLIVLQDAMFFSQDARINALAEDARLPTMHGFRQNAERGGLMSYGVDIPQNFHRAAYFVHRILKGALPGELPIEFPAKVELVINLKTAKALGFVVPSDLLFTADEVIE
jgi:putative ABC transport system substrate-binding protein